MSVVTVRPMQITDLPEVFALERATPEVAHWRRDVYEAMLAAQELPSHVEEAAGGTERRVVVATAGAGKSEVLAGFAVGSMVRSTGRDGAGEETTPTVCEIETVVVRPELRRQSVGRALCTALLEWMHEAGAACVELEVRVSNAGAIALYRSLGFVEQGRRRRYYDDPAEDALLMARNTESIVGVKRVR